MVYSSCIFYVFAIWINSWFHFVLVQWVLSSARSFLTWLEVCSEAWGILVLLPLVFHTLLSTPPLLSCLFLLCALTVLLQQGQLWLKLDQLKPTFNPSLFFFFLIFRFPIISPNILWVRLAHKWVKLGIIGTKCYCCIWKGDKLNGKDGAQLLLRLL